jgi:hypothetical protein
MLFVAGMLLLGLSGQAMAYFTAGDLIQAVYKSGGTGMEVLTDLGSASAWTTAGAVPTNTFTTNLTTSNLSTLFPSTSWSDLNVAYFTYTGVGPNNNLWMSGSADGQTSASLAAGATKNSMNLVMSNAKVQAGTGNQANYASTLNSNTYYRNLDKNGLGIGSFNNYATQKNGEANLAALATGGTADIYLYYYPTATSSSAGPGLRLAKLTIDNTGHTQVTSAPAATPIPATFLLFGSGLLGLVGIRRKQMV